MLKYVKVQQFPYPCVQYESMMYLKWFYYLVIIG